MAAARPQHRLTVVLPPGVNLATPGAALVEPPVRFAGRHLLMPASIRRLRADAWYGPAGLMPLAPLGIPSVLAIHDLAIYINRGWFPARQPFSTRLVVPLSIRRARRLLAVSASTARDLARRFPHSEPRIEVVPEAAGTQFRPLPAASTEAVASRLGLPAGYILFVGTVEPRKNLDTLLDALERVPEAPPLVVAGGWGWGFEATRDRLARMGGRVRVLGSVAPGDLPALYSRALCLAHPAWYEGFGLTPLEAMACGTPVVSSNAASLPEVVGDAALLCDPGSAEQWRAALSRLVADGDLRAELSAQGPVRAGRFSWGRAAEATWRAVEALTG